MKLNSMLQLERFLNYEFEHCHLSKTPGFNSRDLQTEESRIRSANNLVALEVF